MQFYGGGPTIRRFQIELYGEAADSTTGRSLNATGSGEHASLPGSPIPIPASDRQSHEAPGDVRADRKKNAPSEQMSGGRSGDSAGSLNGSDGGEDGDDGEGDDGRQQ